jgi:hypothetical protein
MPAEYKRCADVLNAKKIKPPPEEHEVTAARILAQHYGCTVEFLQPLNSYKQKTPDFRMLNKEWELKSPQGKTKRTIADAITLAKKQSPNIVIDARRTVLTDDYIYREAVKAKTRSSRIKRLVLIGKDKKVLEIT